MADINARFEIGVTTGPIRGSRKVHVPAPGNPDVRVARSLAALFNPVLYPGGSSVLRITQQELAYLVGLSRQRVNEALATLESHGAIQVEYGGLRVMDLQALREARFCAAKRPAVTESYVHRA